MAIDLTTIFENISNVFPDPLSRVAIFQKMFAQLGYDPLTQTLTATDDEQSNSTLRIYVLAYIANTIPYITFTSSTDSLNLISQLKPLFEAEFNDVLLTGEVFSWLSRIYQKSIADISTRGAQLPQVNTFYAESMPLPVIAQYLYQNGARTAELLLRNNDLDHPLFCTGMLEVLAQ
ncbi:hypothetical protein [Gluconobacter frateurii]|uniref:Uncharacterized protein n=1 Tax=Gluconobacter frateurii NRIC 0228 TaxID=1307946 RepID=A0ABQ0QFG7_9PROT|nr:hypothetical protein [Gluconobacter frateurii]GBR17408.1 hypothetical protein AA0228_3020 [Gluconobacter frateurii NRIC 0228]GLP89597.1 hypothetical protein GCM10007868_06720 [Gluconobacter frateurii]